MASQTLTSAQRAELLAKASDAYAETIRLDPYSPFSYFELAQLRLAEGRVRGGHRAVDHRDGARAEFSPGSCLAG